MRHALTIGKVTLQPNLPGALRLSG